MRRIIFFVVGIVLMLLLFTAFTLFLPAKVTVSKSVRINAAPSDLFSQIGNFNNWKNWYPAFRDSEVIVTIQHSNNRSAELRDKYARKVVFRMVAVSSNEVDVGLYVKEKSITTYKIILRPVSIEGTEITWNAITDLGWFPWKKLQGIVLDKVTGEQYESSLKSLKTLIENHTASVSPE